jgi:hypothetical protein
MTRRGVAATVSRPEEGRASARPLLPGFASASNPRRKAPQQGSAPPEHREDGAVERAGTSRPLRAPPLRQRIGRTRSMNVPARVNFTWLPAAIQAGLPGEVRSASSALADVLSEDSEELDEQVEHLKRTRTAGAWRPSQHSSAALISALFMLPLLAPASAQGAGVGPPIVYPPQARPQVPPPGGR